MKRLKQLHYGLWAVIFLFSAVSCSKEDDDVIHIDSGDGNHKAEWVWTDSLKYEYVKSRLLTIDEFSTGAVKYMPRHGMVLNNAYPDVYSIGTDSLVTARDFFFSCCIPDGEEENVIDENGSLFYDMGDYGCVRYTEVKSSDLLAVIDIELVGVDVISRMEVIPTSLWPDNADWYELHRGNIFLEKATGKWWICVADDWSNSRHQVLGSGYALLSFDGEFDSDATLINKLIIIERDLEAVSLLSLCYSPEELKNLCKKLDEMGMSEQLKRVLNDMCEDTNRIYVLSEDALYRRMICVSIGSVVPYPFRVDVINKQDWEKRPKERLGFDIKYKRYNHYIAGDGYYELKYKALGKW